MDKERIWWRKVQHHLHTLGIVGGLFVLMASLGYLLLGINGLLIAGVMGTFAVVLSSRVPTKMIMRMQGGRSVAYHEAPYLIQILQQLAQRANLPKLPQLYYVNSGVMNAFATGTKEDPAIAVTSGLIQQLNQRELAGVLAHEISHLSNNDIGLQRLAQVMTKLTRSFAFIGQILVIINFPLMMMGEATISWVAILLMLIAPTLSTLLLLALSRTREFEADLEAARITGDPGGLANALQKLNYFNGGLMKRLSNPIGNWMIPKILRTHPTTIERVNRLRELVASS